MDTANLDFKFTLRAARSPDVAVRLRRIGERWVAELGAGSGMVGVGATAGAALAAAARPLRMASSRELLCDLSLLRPSLEIIEGMNAASR
jgi:uncharacterized RDD family membrane protein YckC